MAGTNKTKGNTRLPLFAMLQAGSECRKGWLRGSSRQLPAIRQCSVDDRHGSRTSRQSSAGGCDPQHLISSGSGCGAH
jgi:hypothetical protein